MYSMTLSIMRIAVLMVRSSFLRLSLPSVMCAGRLTLPRLHTAISLPALVLIPGMPGFRSAAYLLSRAETAGTLSALLVLTTPWPWVLKALRTLKCPSVIVAILGMTYRYVFEILRMALDMFESRRSRTMGTLSAAESRRLAASVVGVLLSKSFQLSGDVHLAMQSRGFRGEVHILPDFRARTADWCWLAGFLLLAAAALWWGR